jgi:hypothetical protein
MGKRTPESQRLHDHLVEQIARDLKQDYWNVKADLEGWKHPTPIHHIVPDIEATSYDILQICEVETEDTVEQDRPQWLMFKQYCDSSPQRFFTLYIAYANGLYRVKIV